MGATGRVGTSLGEAASLSFQSGVRMDAWSGVRMDA
jgi:hypothetical protein